MNDDDPEENDRPTPTVMLDSEALLAMFREAEQGCWNEADDSDD